MSHECIYTCPLCLSFPSSGTIRSNAAVGPSDHSPRIFTALLASFSLPSLPGVAVVMVATPRSPADPVFRRTRTLLPPLQLLQLLGLMTSAVGVLEGGVNEAAAKSATPRCSESRNDNGGSGRNECIESELSLVVTACDMCIIAMGLMFRGLLCVPRCPLAMEYDDERSYALYRHIRVLAN